MLCLINVSISMPSLRVFIILSLDYLGEHGEIGSIAYNSNCLCNTDFLAQPALIQTQSSCTDRLWKQQLVTVLWTLSLSCLFHILRLSCQTQLPNPSHNLDLFKGDSKLYRSLQSFSSQLNSPSFLASLPAPLTFSLSAILFIHMHTHTFL